MCNSDKIYHGILTVYVTVFSDGVPASLDQLLTYSSQYMSEGPSTTSHQPSAAGPLEMHLLRESLEKEQYRRKVGHVTWIR